MQDTINVLAVLHTSGDSGEFQNLEPGSVTALRGHGHATLPIVLMSLSRCHGNRT